MYAVCVQMGIHTCVCMEGHMLEVANSDCKKQEELGKCKW